MCAQADQSDGSGCGKSPSPSGGGAAPAALTIDQVIASHHRAVYRYAYRLTGMAADAEDLTQQAFLVAQRKLDQIREPEKADRWLFAVVRNCFLKSRRRRRPTVETSLEVRIEDIAVESVADDPVDRELLDRALEELPDEHRLVVVMFYFEDLSYKQIAQEMGVPIGTVMSRLARAKQKLRRHFTAHGSTAR
ncbi:MAG: sigma-70 family RNA polymerase sigma factor [Planctomycetaceae bacterium]|nr:sigma-70 family RNA polymerase sigma factor [Planctomycetaceae bacterium]